MVDAVVSTLIETLLEGALNEGRKVLEFHEQFQKMKKELPHMAAFLKDVDRERMKDQKEIVKSIAREIRELLYEAEDIIEDCELFLKRQERKMAYKCTRYFSLPFLKHRWQMGRRLSQINQEVVVLRERMKAYLHPITRLHNEEHVGSSSSALPESFPILMNDAQVVGLEDDVNKIKKWIMMEADGSLMSVIGIAGMGGIGKTTLAEKIQNDGDVKECFDHVLLVTVSQRFNFQELIKNMLGKLNANRELSNINDVRVLLTELDKQLDGKRYLLILDDVWRVDENPWWESLKSALPQSNNGCCVVVTTRNESVARSMGAPGNRIHRPQILSEEESWSLFAKIAFARKKGECRSREIERIGKEIVAKCGGLPLAIKVVGGVMLGKGESVSEWTRMSENLKEELVVHGENEQILAPLQLSYEELPTHLKPCMLCFAAFPEDCVIDLEDMVYWWIGEGFARERRGKSAYEIGKEYFVELICRGLLLGVRKDDYERRFQSCRVHDMVRDMIVKIAREENFVGLDDRGTDRSRRVGFFTKEMLDRLRDTNSQFLRTMIMTDMEEREEFGLKVRPILCNLKWLRVLSISFGWWNTFAEASNTEWWSGIGSLRHLILLQIENCNSLDRLPDSIGNLQNLQVLSLSYCPNLKRLPAQVTCLEKLSANLKEE